MNPQQDLAAAFRALHTPGRPLVLYNVWDAGSAASVARTGAAALATGSWSIAAAQGYDDGEKVSLALMLDVIARIAQTCTPPLTADLEGGYSTDAAGVADTISQAIAAGVVGCNLEDSDAISGALRDAFAQCERLRQARSAADAACPGFFINARTDLFLQAPSPQHDVALADAALERARAYADAGADGLFVPGLSDLALIERITARSPLPVNVMRLGAAPGIADLASAGVARISHGPAPYLAAMMALEQAATDLR